MNHIKVNLLNIISIPGTDDTKARQELHTLSSVDI